MSEEHWLDVPGFPGYQATEDGEVQSLKRGRTLRLQPRRGRYLTLTMWDQHGRKRQVKVHKIVLTTFRGPRPDGMQACHNNGNAHDNRLSNLRWDTPSANQADALAHGASPSGRKHPGAKLSDTSVRQIRAHRGWLTQRHLAELFGVSQGLICVIMHGNRWRHLLTVSA